MRQAHNILFIMRGLTKLQERYLETLRKTHQLSQIEITIISFLHNNPAHDTASDIADMRMLQKGNVSRGVDSLIRKNLLCRTADAHDRRRIHLSLSDAAMPIVQQIEAQQQALLQQVFAGFTAQECATYASLNARIYQNILTGLERT